MQPQKKRKPWPQIVIIAGYALFLGIAILLDFEPGKRIGNNFLLFAGTMLKMLPVAFVFIGLFEVWVKRETVEKHLGEESGIKGYIWAVLLAGTVVGPLYVALPVAYSLQKKGAKLGVIFTYIGAAAVCRIPMMVFEASFLGLKFTLIRLLVSLPLIVMTSIMLGKYLTKTSFTITENV